MALSNQHSSPNQFQTARNKINNFNALKFSEDRNAHRHNAIYFNLIETVAIPAYSSKQRILPSPTPNEEKTGKECNLRNVDSNKKIYEHEVDGIKIHGSRETIEVVEKALNKIKLLTPTIYSKYIKQSIGVTIIWSKE
ncbi:MAG: hypothetical protein AAF688_15880 [Bacteroidota bacterium]